MLNGVPPKRNVMLLRLLTLLRSLYITSRSVKFDTWWHLALCTYCPIRGPGSVVGTATAYGLDGPGIESRWGAKFSAPVQTGPEAHTASCTMGTRSFPGVRCGRGVTLTPHPLLVPRSKIEESYTSTLPKDLRGL
jgi:hypothetical protein